MSGLISRGAFILIGYRNMANISRREFLTVTAGALAHLANRDAKAEKSDSPQVEVLANGHERVVRGKGKELDPLHSAVAHAFEQSIEREIKQPDNHYTIGNFKIKLLQLPNGEYVLEYSVQLNQAKRLEEVHRVFGLRGKVWAGKEAKARVEKLYAEDVGPWQDRMRKNFPDMKFWAEEQAVGSKILYHRACVMKGAKK